MNTIVTLDHHPISNHPLFPLYVHDHSHQISLMINVIFTQFNHPEVITNFMVGLFTTPNLLVGVLLVNHQLIMINQTITN